MKLSEFKTHDKVFVLDTEWIGVEVVHTTEDVVTVRVLWTNDLPGVEAGGEVVYASTVTAYAQLDVDTAVRHAQEDEE